MLANILATDTPSGRGVGSKGQTNIFLKYQIKGNLAQGTMIVNILPLHTHSTSGMGSKDHFFSFLKVGMLHIEIK